MTADVSRCGRGHTRTPSRCGSATPATPSSSRAAKPRSCWSLPGGWQTSRQSAYSMVTRCVEELHVYVDAETQQTGPHHDNKPIQALGDRWTRDAGKIAATLQRDHQQPDAPLGRSAVDEDLVPAPTQARGGRRARAPGRRGGERPGRRGVDRTPRGGSDRIPPGGLSWPWRLDD